MPAGTLILFKETNMEIQDVDCFTQKNVSPKFIASFLDNTFAQRDVERLLQFCWETVNAGHRDSKNAILLAALKAK